MDAAKSVRANPKPINIFYVWYTELCRRINCTPAPAVKPAKPQCQTVLDFVADRLKVEEWNPIVSALRSDTSLHVISIKSRIGNCQFLHDIDTEEKAKHNKRRFGTIFTAYILKQLLKSLSASLRNTQVLTCLELDGLPIFCQYLEPLLAALKKNKTLKILSFANSSICDGGCQMVCTYLRYTPNVEVVNLSGCGLSRESGDYLAKLIKYQQINRYCESWHNSLRYENPQSGIMRGIKRITINCNPEFGDEGFHYILDELEDDLWLKALDLQKCGITDNLSNKILDVVEYNRSLEIVDLRQNELLNLATVERVLQLLRGKQNFGYQPEYQWCNTALSLKWNSVIDSSSKFSFDTSTIHKTKSAPMKKLCTKLCSNQDILRRSKTISNVQKQVSNSAINSNIDSKYDKNAIIQLNSKLETEIEKRKQIEKRNEELEHRLEEIESSTNCETKPDAKITPSNKALKIPTKKKKTSQNNNKPNRKCYTIKEENVDVEKNGYHIPREKLGTTKTMNGYKNGTNGATLNGYLNGFSSNAINNACKIFERLLMNGKYVEEEQEGENLLDFYVNEEQTKNSQSKGESKEGRDIDVSDSQISLIKFMEGLKTSNNLNGHSHVTRNGSFTSKCNIKENRIK